MLTISQMPLVADLGWFLNKVVGHHLKLVNRHLSGTDATGTSRER